MRNFYLKEERAEMNNYLSHYLYNEPQKPNQYNSIYKGK